MIDPGARDDGGRDTELLRDRVEDVTLEGGDTLLLISVTTAGVWLFWGV
ncbi:MAG: hypothetical protein V5A61_04600 [Haloarculaceae archaeon]